MEIIVSYDRIVICFLLQCHVFSIIDRYYITAKRFKGINRNHYLNGLMVKRFDELTSFNVTD